MSPRRFCLWGGGKDWIQVGSPADQRIQIVARGTASVQHMTEVMGRALLPATERAIAAFSELGRAIEKSRLW